MIFFGFVFPNGEPFKQYFKQTSKFTGTNNSFHILSDYETGKTYILKITEETNEKSKLHHQFQIVEIKGMKKQTYKYLIKTERESKTGVKCRNLSFCYDGWKSKDTKLFEWDSKKNEWTQQNVPQEMNKIKTKHAFNIK